MALLGLNVPRMIGVTFFGLIVTAVFYVVARRLARS
jgi:hypothetical protein